MTRLQLYRSDLTLARGERVLFGVVGVCLLGVLVVASLLNPDKSGYGTHQQLGLPPCTTQVLFGIRCPSCGMTTAWSYLVHGHVWDSLRSNCGGTLLCIAAIVASPLCLLTAWVGRPSRSYLLSKTAAAALVVAISVALVDWLLRIL